MPRCKFIVNWGSNTVNTNSHLWSLMIEARKRTARRSSPIDPYRSPTAARSDWHIAAPPRHRRRPGPGPDARDLARRAPGRRLPRRGPRSAPSCSAQRALEEYPPDRVAAITGVDVADDRDASPAACAREQPSLIRLNYGLQRHHGGGMAVRTIACLPAIVGSWRHPGGGALLSTSGTYDFAMDRLTRPDLSPPGTRTINMNQLAEALAGELPGPPVRALYVYNCNPAAVAPDQQKVLEGLLRDDLFTVVHEQFATDTVDYADIVLPATTQLEHVDLHGSYGHHDVMYNPPAIAPLGECRSNNDVFRALAAPHGLRARALPRRRDPDPRGPRRRPDRRGDHARAARGRGLGPAQPPRAITPRSPTASSPRPRASASSTPSG